MIKPLRYDLVGWLNVAADFENQDDWIKSTWPRNRVIHWLIFADQTMLSVQNSNFHMCDMATDFKDAINFEVYKWPEDEYEFFSSYSSYPNDPASYVPKKKIMDYIMRHGGIIGINK